MTPTTRIEYIESIKENLRCPLDWGGGIEEALFLKKWYYTVSDHLPNGEQDAALLKDGLGDNYLSEPSEEFLSSEFFDEQELRSLFINSNIHKNNYRNQYKTECLKHHSLVAQPFDERRKHYILTAKNIDDIVKKSIENNNVGLLFPNFTPAVQIRFYWSAINDIFERFIFKQENIDDEDSERKLFDAAWKALMTKERFRICVDTLTTIGYYSGTEAQWLIYDTTLSGGITHCYPALDRLSNSFEAVLDDLQGIKEAFINERNDWP
ncbi:hypothetical protein [Methylophaga sp.]|uniref:hypothetical protein n=1 Tax=Methylophaga sp. TaxID=2024840 RepID=UPI003A9162B2